MLYSRCALLIIRDKLTCGYAAVIASNVESDEIREESVVDLEVYVNCEASLTG